ncbi:restriction endonuclease [Companilactobacillus suantsaicola]|uniref:Restriction endonuclease n=1 Tax=Companilactobacillus suantsaicola TaxID=2487723 RepID=A0A4Z0JNP5_9LACO|nr:restriction endonuclease [Companilactobacillus suantsaicola]TGD23777.1 restriction endonuclease [Companilactobacillus suantsaicola]
MDYKKLKLSKHGLPTWDSLMPLVLKYTNEHGAVSKSSITFDVANSLELPENLRNLVSSKYPDDVLIEGRVGWAVSDLFIGGALERPSRGIYQISQLGKKLLDSGEEITRDKVHSLPAYVQHQKELNERNKNINEDDSVDEVAELSNKVTRYNNEIASNLLKKIQESKPTFFERLVVDLLSKMGYKGQNGSAEVTPPTNDGGIDGIINQDPLGTNTVYIQAKRYKNDNVVQRPAIEGFYGALSSKHADRGVFITTSKFSDGAKETAKNFSIVLIDGIQLTNLMLQYQVGVQVKRHLDLFEIDEDFFEE